MDLPIWQQALYGVLTLLLMFGMGASLSRTAFAGVLARPLAFGLGVGLQLFVMPLLGFGAASALALSPADVIGLMLMVTVGGGNASNLLTYLGRADVALGLSMTVTTTLLCVLTAPAWLTVLAGQGIAAPIGAVALTVAMMAGPVPLGMVVRARAPRLAERLDRVGRFAGFGLLAIILGTSALDHLTALARAPGRVLAACALVSGSGIALGTTVGRLAGLARDRWLPLGLEAGVQNLPAALAIIAVAFPAAEHAAIQRTPVLYASVALMLGALTVAGSRRVI